MTGFFIELDVKQSSMNAPCTRKDWVSIERQHISHIEKVGVLRTKELKESITMKDSDRTPLVKDAGTPYLSMSFRLPLGWSDLPCCKTILSSSRWPPSTDLGIPACQPGTKGSGATTCWLDRGRNTIILSDAVQQITQRKEVTL